MTRFWKVRHLRHSISTQCSSAVFPFLTHWRFSPKRHLIIQNEFEILNYSEIDLLIQTIEIHAFRSFSVWFIRLYVLHFSFFVYTSNMLVVSYTPPPPPLLDTHHSPILAVPLNFFFYQGLLEYRSGDRLEPFINRIELILTLIMRLIDVIERPRKLTFALESIHRGTKK